MKLPTEKCLVVIMGEGLGWVGGKGKWIKGHKNHQS